MLTVNNTVTYSQQQGNSKSTAKSKLQPTKITFSQQQNNLVKNKVTYSQQQSTVQMLLMRT